MEDFGANQQIAEIVSSQTKAFKFFLQNIVLDKVTYNALEPLSNHNDVFIFSGIIRDFLTGNFEAVRDFDCVVKDIPMRNVDFVDYLRNSVNYKLNSPVCSVALH